MMEYLYVLPNPKTENHIQLLWEFWSSLMIRSKCTTCCPACSSLQKFYNSILTSSHLYEHWSDCQNLCTNII